MSPQAVLPIPTKEFLLKKKKEHEQALALQKSKDDEFLLQTKKEYEQSLALQKSKDDEFIKRVQNTIIQYIKSAIEERGHQLVMGKKCMYVSLIDISIKDKTFKYIRTDNDDDLYYAYKNWDYKKIFTTDFVQSIKIQGYIIKHRRVFVFSILNNEILSVWGVTIEVYDPNKKSSSCNIL
jgi:hypothetical protein